MSLLDVRDLHVTLPSDDGPVRAVRGLSFEVESGRTTAIVGESGSGKTVSVLALLGLLPGAEVAGSALLAGRDLVTLNDEGLRKIRGVEVGIIFQDASAALHPCFRVGWQIRELVRARRPSVSKRDVDAMVVELLGRVGLNPPEVRAEEYPHQYSGGMRQRALIAMAIALRPRLLIADEPTSGLDVVVQAQILEVLKQLQTECDTGILFITHDLRLVAQVADDVVVTYAGTAVEVGDRREILEKSCHPYPLGLLASLPRVGAPHQNLMTIRGHPPSAIEVPSGCSFHPRCPYAVARCVTERPTLVQVSVGGRHRSACWRALELAEPHVSKPRAPEHDCK